MGTKTRSRSIKPEYNSSPEAEKDLSLYECQFETTTCEAETKSCEITKELMAGIYNPFCVHVLLMNESRYFFSHSLQVVLVKL